MLVLVVVVAAVSAALILGAIWGAYGPFNEKIEGFVLAVGGGALMLSAVLELIQPAVEDTDRWTVSIAVFAGAATFALLDYLVDEVWGKESGAGLLTAVTLDGIPENLALGVAMIGAGFGEVAALAGAIALSNIPEAAAGARRMDDAGLSSWQSVLVWVGAAAVLGLAAVLGNLLLVSATSDTLAIIRSFAAGAVVAALATEIFPSAYRQHADLAGVATAIGLLAALALA